MIWVNIAFSGSAFPKLAPMLVVIINYRDGAFYLNGADSILADACPDDLLANLENFDHPIMQGLIQGAWADLAESAKAALWLVA